MTQTYILLVDDHALNAELASFVLEQAGCRVAVASDAQGAWRALEGEVPDLVLMDIQLPGMDGLELTQRIKADPAVQGVTVVALTAYAMKGDSDRFRAAGCDGYLAKPIDVATFAGQVLAFLPHSADL
jgi:two-component system cell cycle response regulator DivK